MLAAFFEFHLEFPVYWIFFVLFYTLSFHPTYTFRFRQLTDSYIQHFSTPLHLVMGKAKL